VVFCHWFFYHSLIERDQDECEIIGPAGLVLGLTASFSPLAAFGWSSCQGEAVNTGRRKTAFSIIHWRFQAD
jgi:hypothetical protein